MASDADTLSDANKGGYIALGELLFLSPHRPFLTIIVGGIGFQFVAVVVYMLLTTEFLIRFTLNKPFPRREDTLNGAWLSVLDSKTKQMVLGVGLSSFAVLVRWAPPFPFHLSGANKFGSRGFYRIIELANGWEGRIISNETYFSKPNQFTHPRRLADALAQSLWMVP